MCSDMKIQKVDDGAESYAVNDVAQRSAQNQAETIDCRLIFSMLIQCKITPQINSATVTSTQGMAGWSECSREKLTPLFQARTKLKKDVILTGEA